jgi:hypothetical protein
MKYRFLMVLTIVILFAAVSCSDNHIQLRIPVQKSEYVDLDKYQKILVTDFKTTITPDTFNPGIFPKEFFLDDFSKFTNKKVEYLKVDESKAKEPEKLKEFLAQHPDSLLVTGNMSVEIKETSIIKEIKNKFGDKIKSFVKIKNWSIKLDINLFESNSGAKIRSFNLKYQLKDNEGLKDNYNYNAVFNNVTDQFIRSVTRKNVMQRRFLLLR